MPSTYTAAPDVTFYGEPVALDTTGTYDYMLTIDYADADEALDPNGIRVTGGDIVIGDDETDVTFAANTYTGTILGEDGEYYTFSLTQSAANSTATLSGTYVSGNELIIPGGAMRLQTYLYTFTPSTGATVQWTIKLNGENAVTFEGMTLDASIDSAATTDTIEAITAVVTSEDESTTATYMDTDSLTDANQAAVANAKTAAIQAIEDAVKEALEAAGVADPDTAMDEDTMTLSGSFAGLTMKGVMDTWTTGTNSISVNGPVSDVNDYRDSAVGQATALAQAYLTALEAEATIDANNALNQVAAAVNGQAVTTATVTDPAGFEAAITAAVKQLVAGVDSKADVTVGGWGDLSTQIDGMSNNAGRLTVTGVYVTISYEGTATTVSRNLGSITIPYNMNA